MALETTDLREARRQSARDAIVQTAWALSRELGLAGWSIRDLARRSGITTPTVYVYFDSKNSIYDAMFGQAATEFADRQAEPYDVTDPRHRLLASIDRFFEFCTTDPPRYQLLFQRTLPGFEPSGFRTSQRCGRSPGQGRCSRRAASPNPATLTCGRP